MSSSRMERGAVLPHDGDVAEAVLSEEPRWLQGLGTAF